MKRTPISLHLQGAIRLLAATVHRFSCYHVAMHALRSVVVFLSLASASWAQTGTSEIDIPVQWDSMSVQADTSGVPQRDAMDLLRGLFGKRVEPQLDIKPKTGLQWALLPTISYNPVYGVAIGAMISGAGRRGSEESRYSSLSIAGNVSTTGQIQFQVRGDVFSPHENYLAKGDFRYLDTERSTWGLGPIDDQQGEFPMTFLLNRFYFTALRRISGPVYLGVGYHYDSFGEIVDKRAAVGDSTPFVEYSGGAPTKTTASGLSINLLADTRDNLVNASNGYYLSWSFRDYLEVLGSDQNWQELWIEARVYPHVPTRSRNVLAFWLYGWMSFGKAPYLNLPSNSWDTYGRASRGYLAGRIRGVDQIYIESEYRWSLTKDGLWGMVAFVNGVSTTRQGAGTYSKLDTAVGVGIRIKFNKHTDTNLTLDHAWGREDSRGWFLGMTEVF